LATGFDGDDGLSAAITPPQLIAALVEVSSGVFSFPAHFTPFKLFPPMTAPDKDWIFLNIKPGKAPLY